MQRQDLTRRTASGIRRGLSSYRKMMIQLQYANIEFGRQVFLDSGVRVRTWGTGRVIIQHCSIGRNSLIEAADGATVTIDASYVGPGCIIVARGRISIGRETKIAEYSVIRDANHDRSVPLGDRQFVTKPVTIGESVWIGAGVRVLAGVTVSDHATVGAGSVVTHSVASGITVAGTPAVPIH